MNPDEKKKLIENKKQELDDALTKTRAVLLSRRNTKFLATEVLRLPMTYVHNLPMPTMGTDGKHIYIDPEFMLKMKTGQRITGLCHETFHVMFGHCDRKRKGKKSDQLWNIAADCVTNAMLKMSDIGNDIPNSIIANYNGNVELTINGKKLTIKEAHKQSVEEVFHQLVQHCQNNPPKGGGGKGKGNNQGDNSGEQEVEVLDKDGNKIEQFDAHMLGEQGEEERGEREEMLRQKMVEHKMRGTLPGWLAEKIEKMLKGKVNWKAEIREFITPEIKTWSSFSRVHKRSYSLGMTLPGMIKEGVDVAFAVDVSGSIGSIELQQFIGEIQGLFKAFEPGSVKAKIYFHDVPVTNVYDIHDEMELMKMEHKGGGGTSHVPVFERAEEDNVKVLICLTDGCSSFPEYTKIRKVLWLVTDENGANQIPANLGKKIVIELGDE